MKQEAAPEGLCLLLGWAELAQTMPFNRTHGSLELFSPGRSTYTTHFCYKRTVFSKSQHRQTLHAVTVRCCCREKAAVCWPSAQHCNVFLSKDTTYRTSQNRLVTGFVPAIGTCLPTSLVTRGHDRLGSWNSVRHGMADSRHKTGTQKLFQL